MNTKSFTPIGYFSEKAAAAVGSGIFLDENGKEVEVTATYTSTYAGQEYKWDDKVLVSECLVKRIRNGRPPTDLNAITAMY